MNPKRIKTNVKFPDEINSVYIKYDKEYYSGRPYRYVTMAYLYDKTNRLVGFGSSACNCGVDSPNKRIGRDKALGRAVQDYYACKDFEAAFPL